MRGRKDEESKRCEGGRCGEVAGEKREVRWEGELRNEVKDRTGGGIREEGEVKE